MIFKGGILGSVQNFLGDPYLNGTTIPFDMRWLKNGKSDLLVKDSTVPMLHSQQFLLCMVGIIL